jgi:hypothetical protein
MKQPTYSQPKPSILNTFAIFCWLWASFTPALAESPETHLKPPKIESMGTYPSFSPNGDIRRFAGETLLFDMDYMIFSKAAQAEVSFYEENGKFKCVLVAETKGLVGFLTSYVKHVYKSTFDIIDDGKRLRTATFEREIIEGNDRERIFHAIDYTTKSHYWFIYHNEILVRQFSESITGEVHLDDVLGLFYNFRNSVYGKIEKGRHYKVSTFWTKEDSKEKTSEMTIYIPTDLERLKFEEEEYDTEMGAKLLMKVLVPSDLFETKNGELYFWSSEHYIPMEAIYKDFILFGDLHLKFVKRTVNPEKTSTSKRR